jgi:hypothetical protein
MTTIKKLESLENRINALDIRLNNLHTTINFLLKSSENNELNNQQLQQKTQENNQSEKLELNNEQLQTNNKDDLKSYSLKKNRRKTIS